MSGTNSYSGGTTISAGTLQIGSGSATGSLGTGAVTNNATLAFNRSGGVSITNTISGTGATTFAGGGTYTITGANTSSGTVAINSATVLANNATNSLGTGAITVATGGTLGGSGAVGGAVTVQSGGKISPGASAGLLTVNNDVTFQPGANLVSELNGNDAGTSYDQLLVNGNVALGSSNLLLSLGAAPASTDFFYLILNNGVGATTGAFAGFAEGGAITASFGGTTYQGNIYYGANSATNALTGGNDVLVTGFAAIPEPSTVALLGLTLLPGAALLRRRK